MGKKKTSKRHSRPLVDPPHKTAAKPAAKPQQVQHQVELNALPEFQLIALLNAEYAQVMRSKENINAINAELMKRFDPRAAQVKAPEPEKPKSPVDVKEKIIK